MNKSILLSTVFSFLAFSVNAQTSLLQTGNRTAGHVPMYATTGGPNNPLMLDSGPAGGGNAGIGINELSMTIRGNGTPPFANAGTGQLLTNFCDYDAPITNATGYHFFCLSPNAQGGGLLAYGNGGIASPLPLQFYVNGSYYSFPFTVGGIVGPVTSVVNDFACWNNTTGTLLKDCSAGSTTLIVGTTPITSGTSGRIEYNNAGILGELPVGTTGISTIIKTLPSGLLSPSIIPPLSGCTAAGANCVGTFNIVSYGADPTGTTDSTAAIAAAITAAKAVGFWGGTVYAPAGKYLASSITLPVNYEISLIGDGPTNTIFIPTSTVGNFLTINGAATTVPFTENSTLRDFSIAPVGAMPTNSDGIFINANFVTIQNVHMTGQSAGSSNYFYNAVHLAAGASYQTTLENMVITGASHAIVQLGDTSSTAQVDTGVFNNVNTACGSSSPGDGILVYTTGGLTITNSSVLSCQHGFRTFPGTGQDIFGVFLEQFISDSTTGDSIAITTNGGTNGNITIDNTWGSSSTGSGNGVTISGISNGINVNGGQFINNAGDGIHIGSGATNVVVNGAQVFNNSQSGSGAHNGIQVEAGVSYFEILNSQSGNGGQMQNTVGINNQNYGIFVAAGGSNHYVISNNSTPGNVTGTISDGGTGLDKFVCNNIPSGTACGGGGSISTFPNSPTTTVVGGHNVIYANTSSAILGIGDNTYWSQISLYNNTIPYANNTISLGTTGSAWSGVWTTALNASGTITTGITGSTQCLQVNSSGVIGGFGALCGGSGPVSTFPNSATTTISGGHSVIYANTSSAILGIGDSAYWSQISLNNNTIPYANNTISLGTVGSIWSGIWTNALNVAGTITAASGSWSSSGISGTAITGTTIGTSSPSTGAFTTLTTSGTITIPDTTYIQTSGGAKLIEGNSSNLYLNSLTGSANNFFLGPTGTFWGPGIDSSFHLGNTGFKWADVWAANGVIQTSDERLKKNITNETLGLDFILNLRPVTYEWKDNSNGVRHGLIAQDVEKALNDTLFAGLEKPASSKNYYGLNYAEFDAPMIKAIQELNEKVTALEKKSK